MIRRIPFFIALLFIPSLLQAQSYTDIVWQQIQEAYEVASDEGYSMQNYIFGTNEEAEGNSWTFYLDNTMVYQIKAFCDQDCDNLDLVLYDESGRKVISDELEDDYPVVDFIPAVSGNYQIEVVMTSCSVGPCYWGLALFLK